MRGNCPFNYSGGRSDFAHVWQTIHRPVCNLLSGGGGIWSNLSSRDIIVNDTCRPMLEFQRLIYELGDISEVVTMLYDLTMHVDTREAYEELRNNFNYTMDPILFMACISCSHNNEIRFNTHGHFNQTWGRRKFNANQERKLWDFKRRIANKNVKFIFGDYANVDPGDRLVIASPPTDWGADEFDRFDKFTDVYNRLVLLTSDNSIGKKAKMHSVRADGIFTHSVLTNIRELKSAFVSNRLF